jgi:transposase
MVFGTMNGSKPGWTKAELEARRRLAVQRVTDGWAQKDVAAFLGVHPVTVAKWVAAFRAAGEAGLAARPTPGRPRLLTPDQEAQVLSWLLRKPTEFGFRTDLWTATRVAHLIRERFGVEYHPGYLREWLSKRDHSPQKPARRPKQRDPVEIGRWLSDDYPPLEKKSGRTTPTSC